MSRRQGVRLARLLVAGLASLPVGSRGEAVVRPSEAMDHLGESVIVEGEIDSVVCSPQACLLSFEPGFAGLVVSLPASVERRTPEVKAAYEARRVRVRGTVVAPAGRPRIELPDARSIELVGGATTRSAIVSVKRDAGLSAPADKSLPPQVRVEAPEVREPPAASLSAREAAAQLGLAASGSRPRRGAAGSDGEVALGPAEEIRLLRRDLATLTARIELLEERLERLGGELDGGAVEGEQVGDAASDGVGSEPPRPVVARSSPASMHRVKRGWKAARVLRIFGEPLEITGNPPGPFIWQYEDGRAVTIDEHGLVVSSIGF